MKEKYKKRQAQNRQDKARQERYPKYIIIKSGTTHHKTT
jgi:hypothetical protein